MRGRTGARCSRFRSQRGFGLIVALSFMLIISIGAVAVISYTSSSMRDAYRMQAQDKAMAVAEAGLANALAVLANLPDPSAPATLTSGGAIPFGDGTYTYSGSRSGSTWTLSATGTIVNPTGGSARTRTVSAQAQVSGGAPIGDAWNYVFIDNPVGCFTIENTVEISAALYVGGDFCLRNSAAHIGLLLDVAGTVQTEGLAAVGTSTTPVPLVRVAGGCRNSTSGPFVAPCGSAQRVWTSSFTSVPPAITKPPVDLDTWYASSKPGPGRYCTSGSFPGGSSSFDNDTMRNASGPTINLLPVLSYDCTVLEGGSVVGRIAWIYGDPGVLTVQGVVYFDGEILLDTNVHAVYAGRGAIYASGRIVFDGTTSICAVASCSGAWDPNASVIVFVSGSTDDAAIELKNQARVQAAAYAVGGFRIANSAAFSGPLIADRATATNSGLLGNWVPFALPVTGIPSTGEQAFQVTLIPSSWRS